MIATDARTLWQLLRGQQGHGSHADRLQAFYGPQVARYDNFRERLLQGRRELVGTLPTPSGARLVELGAGTGRNLDFFGERLAYLAHVALVDLCPALLEHARVRTRGLSNVSVVEADVVHWQPDEPVDVVMFSYSLTMVPDWRRAIDNAVRMLRPGGVLGVVDFFLSYPDGGPGRAWHGSLARAFWRRWFGHDGVRLNPHHLAHLMDRLPNHELWEGQAAVPYLPGLKVPYYRFVGRVPAADSTGPG